MASSSSPRPEIAKQDLLVETKKSVAPTKLYDVFINHRGPDVKETLAYDLYNYLQQRGCRAFLDSEEIEFGDSIPSTLSNAIQSSSVQISIFSETYADSPWCLNELALMLKTDAMFIPVFYGVAPSDLRHIREGKGIYAAAFANYETRGRYIDNLDNWKTALCDASSFSGYELKKNSQYHSMCSKLVSAVEQEVQRRKPLEVAKHPVGLDKLVADFESHCGQNGEEKNVKIIGIFAMGGSGKTTLAKELFNRYRSNYNGSCFAANVREASVNGKLASLQTKIIKDLFKEVLVDFQNISEGTAHLRNRLKSAGDSRYLIVLDDIDQIEQLDALLCMDALGSDSLVIITTRDKGVLKCAGITLRYNLKTMDRSNATELFSWHAFKRPNPDKDKEDLVGRFVQLCQGLPLSLQVLGGHLSGRKDKQYWLWELSKVEKLLPKNLEQRLKISYDALDSDEREIFLDIACFFIGKPKNMAISIWKGSGWNAELAVQSLKEKSLVEVEYSCGDHVIRMHDHLRDMGREIADNLSKHSRLWRPAFLKPLESRGFQNILTETNGRCFHSIFDQSIGCMITYFVGESNASDERSRALLWLELDLRKGELKSIPSWIPLQSLWCLRIVNGRLTRLWQDDLQSIIRSQKGNCPSDAEVHFELKELLLESTVFEEFPNTLGKLIYLETLRLTNDFRCDMLMEGRSFSESLRKLRNLRSLVLWHFSLSGELDLSNGKDAANFGFSIARVMSHLQTIHIRGVKLTSKISICGENCPILDSLRLDSMANLAEVHLRKVTTLNTLKLMFCKELRTVSGFFDLRNLKKLSIKECAELEEVPNLSCLTSLETIIIDQCKKLQNINGIEDLEGLKYLYLSTGCGGVGLGNHIQRMKRLPSDCTIVIGRAVDGAESTLNANFFSGLVSTDAVTEIDYMSQSGKREDSVKMPDSLSAIIMCALVYNYFEGLVKTPITTWRPYADGDRIVTMVLTGQQRVYGHLSLDFDLEYTELKKKCVVTLNRGEEFKALNIFKTIIAQLYQDIP